MMRKSNCLILLLCLVCTLAYAQTSLNNKFITNDQNDQNCAACTWHWHKNSINTPVDKKTTNNQYIKVVNLNSNTTTYRISLASNATTGYTWKAVYDANLLELMENKYIAPNTHLLGAPGQQTWLFKATTNALNGHHETVIKFNYQRPWEKNVAPAKTTMVKVIIN